MLKFCDKPAVDDELNLEVKTGEISFCSLNDDDDKAEFAIVVVSRSPRVNVISRSPRGDVVSSVMDWRVRRGLENNFKNENVFLKKYVKICRDPPTEGSRLDLRSFGLRSFAISLIFATFAIYDNHLDSDYVSKSPSF